MNFNRVIIGGHVCRDPELKAAGQSQVCKFAVAVNRKWGSGDSKKEEVAFIDCEAWGKTAETIAQYFKKGKAILIEGRLKQDRWEDKNGGKRTKLFVLVDSFVFVGEQRQQRDDSKHSDSYDDYVPPPADDVAF